MNHEIHETHEKVETLAEIVAEIRKDKTPYSAKVAKKLDKQTVGDRVLMEDAAQCLRDDEHYIKSLADRIEAAHKREVDKLNSVIQAQRSEIDSEQDGQRRELKKLQREYDKCARDYNNAQRARSIAESELRELKKSIGNVAAMREALESFCTITESDVQELVRLSKRLIDEDIYGGGIIQKLVSDIGKARAALAKPPRQCDVGTADEQAERFENFCLKHIGCAEETGGRHCVGCPLEKASKNITQKCELYWAQMPYEEGDNA